MRVLERINNRGTTVIMVTHAKEIVDRMNKRVIAIENGHIIRDDVGSYGYKESQKCVPEEGAFGNYGD